MNYPLQKKIIIYSSLFITAVISIPKLLALQHDGIMARITHFNLYEWLLQVLISFVFCSCVFYYNKNLVNSFGYKWGIKKYAALILKNALLLCAFGILGGVISRLFFFEKFFPLNGYFVRLSFALFLIAVELKILNSVYTAQQKEKENENLRNANMVMEIELLKSQLNPHFFFNALSSLSAVVRENPPLAQQYISHLSKTFRYSLQKPGNDLVTVKEEISAVTSYIELMKMRHEEGFKINIVVDENKYNLRLPHMSLQPLVENALKHNIVSISHPLQIEIYSEDNFLVVKNNVQPNSFSEPGTGIGLANLNSRYKILLQKEIEIINGNELFIIKLPLK